VVLQASERLDTYIAQPNDWRKRPGICRSCTPLVGAEMKRSNTLWMCVVVACATTLAACVTEPGAAAQRPARIMDVSPPFQAGIVAEMREPWAMVFLPDGRMLVTEKGGSLRLVTQDGTVADTIAGVPDVDYGGHGGLGDVALHPAFAENGLVYLTWAEAGDGDTRGAAMGRGRLDLAARRIDDFEVIWRQTPKVAQRNHYSHRMAFSPDGQHLFVTSGDRWIPETAQDTSNNLGAVLRLTLDGAAPPGNPMYDRGGASAEIWSYGHRSPLGLAFDAEGTLWEIEMGPTSGSARWSAFRWASGCGRSSRDPTARSGCSKTATSVACSG
jgi:glucose/arabinose dehydrogenase